MHHLSLPWAILLKIAHLFYQISEVIQGNAVSSFDRFFGSGKVEKQKWRR